MKTRAALFFIVTNIIFATFLGMEGLTSSCGKPRLPCVRLGLPRPLLTDVAGANVCFSTPKAVCR